MPGGGEDEGAGRRFRSCIGLYTETCGCINAPIINGSCWYYLRMLAIQLSRAPPLAGIFVCLFIFAAPLSPCWEGLYRSSQRPAFSGCRHLFLPFFHATFEWSPRGVPPTWRAPLTSFAPFPPPLPPTCASPPSPPTLSPSPDRGLVKWSPHQC